MNKIFNYFSMLLASVLALTLGACTEEFEFTRSTIEGEQVYFSNSLPSSVDLVPTETEAKVPVNRVQRSGALTVPITVTAEEGCPFNISSEVTFADGDSVAHVTISYNPEAIEYGRYYDIALAIGDENVTTPYGETSYTFSAGKSEWNPSSTQNGFYREGIMSNFFSDIAVSTYEVDIQESLVTPGRYRVVNPYGIRFDGETGTQFYQTYINFSGSALQWVGDALNTSIEIDATDPDFVYIDGDFYPGCAFGTYGTFHSFSLVTMYMSQGRTLEQLKASAPDIFGKLRDGVITFPARTIATNFTNDYDLNGIYSSNNDQLAIALPGHEIRDYSSSFTYTGRFTDIAEHNYVQGEITLGADVAMAKYVIAAVGDDVQAIVDAVADGSIEGTIVNESGEIQVSLEESGDFHFIIVTYDESGSMRGSSVTAFTYSIEPKQEADWQFVCNGTYFHAFQNYFSDLDALFQDQPSYTTTLYQDANDPTRYKIDPYGINPNMPLTFEFTMDENGTIEFEYVETGYVTGDNQGNEFTIWGTDAGLFTGGELKGSYYSPEYDTYYFANIYHILVNGETQYGWAEWDAFVPDGAPQGNVKATKMALQKLKSTPKRMKANLKGFTTGKYGKAVKLNRK